MRLCMTVKRLTSVRKDMRTLLRIKTKTERTAIKNDTSPLKTGLRPDYQPLDFGLNIFSGIRNRLVVVLTTQVKDLE
jgi:hypothetical protein